MSKYLLILLFLFFRLYNLNDSFFFFNDMGRDTMVLQTWQDSGKPPLLGPQTSALPFNQSAIYFYLLYPGFILSGGNPVSSLYTLAFVYLFSFVFCLYLIKKYKLPISYLILHTSFFLIAIHPQYITQARFVWNPSFVTPFLLISIISFYLLLQKYSTKLLIVFAFSIATAVSISYSVAPLLIMFAIYWLLFNRQHFLSIALTLFSSLALINLPTIFFELRHGFLLTSSLFTKNSPTQDFLTFPERLNRLSSYVFNLPTQNLNIILLAVSLILSLYLLFINRHQKSSLQFLTSFLYIGITILAFVTPISIQTHYIFAFTSLLFIIIASLPKFYLFGTLIFFTYFYLQPHLLNQHFQPARRTYSQMQSCFKTYCDNFKDATFVSVNSSFHPFHNGPEHRFLLKKAGCQILDIETQNGQTKYMTVVLDDSKFDTKTKYYELELLGNNQEISRLKCQDNFELVTLEKI